MCDSSYRPYTVIKLQFFTVDPRLRLMQELSRC